MPPKEAANVDLAMTVPEKFTVTLTRAQLQVTLGCLSTGPYREVAAVIDAITRQAEAATAAAQVTPDPPDPPP